MREGWIAGHPDERSIRTDGRGGAPMRTSWAMDQEVAMGSRGRRGNGNLMPVFTFLVQTTIVFW
jgi:hypothetical protein